VPGQPCQPAAADLRVEAGAGSNITVPVAPPTSVCEGGSIQMGSLLALPDQIFFSTPSTRVECDVGVNVGSVSAFAYCQTAGARSGARSVSMSASGRLKICNGIDCLANPPENVSVLAVGHHASLGPFQCTSLGAGVQCSVASGRGFRITPHGIARTG
jgi:hypothetical protein